MDPQDEVTIADVAHIIHKKLELPTPILWDSSFSDGQYKKTANNAKLKSLLDTSFTFTPIQTGIEETIDWFLQNYESV